MITPSLTNFADYVITPQPAIPKSKGQIQHEMNTYMNILLGLVIITGIYYLYRRYITKDEREEETKHKLRQFDNYLQEYYINDMLQHK